jgi:predicted RNA-binding protein
MWKNISLCLIVSLATSIGMGLAQTGRQPNRKGILPAEAYLMDRESNLEQELRRLKDAESAMGPNHPKLTEVQRRIAEGEKELETMRAIPNPLARMEEQGVNARDIVDQISEKELRGLAVRLALDLKDLRKRVDALERANPPR